MEGNQPKTKNLAYDALVWFFLICFLAILALGMLIRDAKKQYGVVSFGTFPVFEATDPAGKRFNQHRLHGQLSAVAVSDEFVRPDYLLYLKKLSLSTAMGTKYLHVLILTDQAAPATCDGCQYLTLDSTQYQQIEKWRSSLFKEGFILVDQNGIIRGVFNLDDKLDRMNFEGAVKGIL